MCCITACKKASEFPNHFVRDNRSVVGEPGRCHTDPATRSIFPAEARRPALREGFTPNPAITGNGGYRNPVQNWLKFYRSGIALNPYRIAFRWDASFFASVLFVSCSDPA